MRLLGLALALLGVAALTIAAGAGAFGGSWRPARGVAQPPGTAKPAVVNAILGGYA
jgi:hypothetical protein